MVAEIEFNRIAKYISLDLEIEQENNSIYKIGLDSAQIADEFTSDNLDKLKNWLIYLKQQGLTLLGHNFRRFDAEYLFQEYPELESWSIVDTLELSVIIKPLQLSHKLHKDYKLSDYAGNNPLEDARATRLLFRELIRDFLTKPLSLQYTYAWLFSCGNQDADLAYLQLFNLFNLNPILPPDISSLPREAIVQRLATGEIATLELENLRFLWQNAPNLTFNRRLCIAAILAWNYESNVTKQQVAFSQWLTHLPDFPEILEQLIPVTPQGFSYHPYLSHFGLQQFRPIQEETVRDILAGKRPLLIMATGGGKSLCYQLPALMLYDRQRALTVVISPLQALMADQVAELESMGLHFATFINGTLTASQRKQRLEQLYCGTKGLLYISPEQLRSISIISLLSERVPTLWIIDEAHCISQWGQSFRPDYRYIPKFIQELYQDRQLPLPRFALMTATATLKVREDIKQLFSKHNLNIGTEIISNQIRENLQYQVIPSHGHKEIQLLNLVQQEYLANNCTLIYAATRKNAERIAQILNNAEINARYYHGNISREEKQEILEAFKQKELNIITATCAFGMGINRPDVRHVIHYNITSNLENYIQESGRAGRDGLPSTCTIFFDENDADLIFFLQSLNHLSEIDLKNIFLSIRAIRGLVYQKATEAEWFWVTVGEIFARSQLDEELDPEQQDIKIKVALHYLETFGLLQRAENLSTFINFNLKHRTPQQSLAEFSSYSTTHQLTKYQIIEFERLICAMHALNNYYRRGKISPQIPIEVLSDESGLDVLEVKNKIRELKRAGVCTVKLPITILLSKRQRIVENTKDARVNLLRICEWENMLLKGISEIQKTPESGFQVNLRALAVRLDPDDNDHLRASNLRDILNGWVSQHWLTLKQLNNDLVRLDHIQVEKYLARNQAIAKSIIAVFYEDLQTETGDYLRLDYELEELLVKTNQQLKNSLNITSEELEMVLIWLHERKIIRLTEGLNLFHQALKIRVNPKVQIDLLLKHKYQEIENYYRDEARRTHLMVEYAKLQKQQEREKLIQDYFQLPQTDFETLYPSLEGENCQLPVTQADYNKIIGSLNPSQREIVLAEEHAIAVIAGPGSGKTRTIVHRIAYLIKVKRVPPNRILVLAYNRNAIRELQLRLLNLVGYLAFDLNIFTFHGLALALLGRTLGEERIRDKEINFEQILDKACDLLESNETADEEDIHINRLKLLGNLEYIFVDEYQDVAEKEYRLIQLLSGKGISDDPSRSVVINLCVIGDDDQNIYEFRGTDVRYIIQFETEYKARQFLLVDNYRSTQSIINAANNLIIHNKLRCKKTPTEQVRIAPEKQAEIDIPPEVHRFNNSLDLAIWVKQKVQNWIKQGVNAKEIAILAREWDNLNTIRLLLEREEIVTYTLKTEIPLVRNFMTHLLLTKLQNNSHLVINSNESVENRFKSYFFRCGYNLNQPTIKTLLKIAQNLDLERGYGSSEDIALPISVAEIINAIYEFSNSGDTYLDETGILVTSAHGAKGLEFSQVILLSDNFTRNESERRLFYVGMTRAKQELIICSSHSSQFVSETGINSNFHPQSYQNSSLPETLIYLDFTPGEVYLGCSFTLNQQQAIKHLQEGEYLLLRSNQRHDNWNILTRNNITIGALSRRGVQLLKEKNIHPESFEFRLGEVTVKHIFRHLKIDQLTGVIEDSSLVVIPQIRICR